MRLACRDLPQWFRKDATIITPTAFLAGVAHEQFARERLQQGIETWERPSIYGLDAWLVSCWSEARYSAAGIPTLLSTAQELTLWHAIIEREQPHLFDISATVRLAREAAELLSQWHIPSEGEAWNEHADARQFQQWHRLLRRKCRENGWMTRSDLARVVPGWMADGTIRPRLTVFVGFEATPPSLEKLQDALGDLSVRLAFDRNSPSRKAKAKHCEDAAGEIEFAARRLRYLFEENPTRSLALFVPELGEQHGLVERTLDAVFFPSSAAKISGPPSAAVESLFRMASSGRLLDHPLVSAALLLLNLASPRIDQADAGAILRCPFVRGAAAERDQRALADVELRKRRELDVSLEDMARASRACAAFHACLQRAGKIVAAASQVRTLGEWSKWISELLVAMGWPGEMDLTAHEERIVERWKEQLSTLSGLGLVSPPVTCETAVANLRRLLTVRLERGEWSSPIQVLDAAQAEGVVFDAVVAMGLSEETWPPRRRISPLIPLPLQRFRQNSEECSRVTRSLFESAPDVVVTYHGRMAAAAAEFTAKKEGALASWAGQLPLESFPPAALQQFSDGQAPPFVMQGEMRGGTGIIKAQSQCPFQAFAKYRLQARRPEDASFGFDALDRGSFAHKALEKIWQRLESQSKLRGTSPQDLRLLVAEAVAEAVPEKESGPLHQLSVATERARLQELVMEWLDVERDRSEPFTVETIEQERRFEVAGLSLQLRVDRIDRLKNGSLVLIDYKSGKQTKPKLCGDRPPEPQLLVYAASVDSPVDGIFFGQVKPRDVKAVGYSRTRHFKGSATEVKKDWQAYMETSRQNVASLAKEFVEGVAEVRPTGAPCEYCGLKPFCRVNERGTAQQEEE